LSSIAYLKYIEILRKNARPGNELADQNYDLTIVGSMKHYIIPYGVCKTDSSGMRTEMQKKPEYDFLVNTGLYIMKPSVLKIIPKETYFEKTDLVREAKLNGVKIGVYPVSEKSWIDVGQWSGFNSVIKDFENKSQEIND
jgi:NDP-sugar pyrophosphorylase family protein